MPRDNLPARIDLDHIIAAAQRRAGHVPDEDDACARVAEEKVKHVDRLQTLELYEASVELDDAVGATVMRERERDDG